MKTSSSVGRRMSDVVDLDPLGVEPAYSVGDRAAVLANRDADRAVVGRRALAGELGERRDRRSGLLGTLERDLDPLAADAAP